jgi:hypothetical protein
MMRRKADIGRKRRKSETWVQFPDAPKGKDMFLLENEVVKEMIDSEQFNPWVGTPFEGYKQLNNIQKGNVGEKIVKTYLLNNGFEVKERRNRTDGYDAIVNRIKTEIKFSLAQTDNVNKRISYDTFIMNHVSEGKEWERLIFLGVNPDMTFHFKYLTKSEFSNHFKNEYFNRQQGGSQSDNDDYMCSGRKLINMLSEMKGIDKW